MLWSLVGFIGAVQGNQLWKEIFIDDWVTVDHWSAWNDWKNTYNKKYETLEKEKEKFEIWIDNWKRINDFNAEKNTFIQVLNKFADLNDEEFRWYINGGSESCLTNLKSKWIVSDKETNGKRSDLPNEIDWTNINGKSYVTPVKNQGQCGACYAFSVTGSIESRNAIYHNITDDDIVTLSEQQIVDCSQSYGNDGCNGGLMDYGFEYVKNVHGLCSEDEYFYTGEAGMCNDQNCGTKYDDIIGYNDVTIDNETALMEAVSKGPVSIAIQANQRAFQFYKTGVLNGRCGDRIDHGVLVVGYGTLNGQEYWKVKNSWGNDWGQDGYVLICRNCNQNGNEGECGILMQPSFIIPK